MAAPAAIPTLLVRPRRFSDASGTLEIDVVLTNPNEQAGPSAMPRHRRRRCIARSRRNILVRSRCIHRIAETTTPLINTYLHQFSLDILPASD